MTRSLNLRTTLLTTLAALALAGATSLRAQGDFELTRVDKIELFLQHLGKVVQIDLDTYRSFVLEYEVARNLQELGEAPSQTLLGDFIGRCLEKLHPRLDAARELIATDTAAAEKELRELSRQGDAYLSAYARLELAELAHAAGDHAACLSEAERLADRARRYLLEDHRACELVAKSYEGLDKPLMEFLQYAILLTDYPNVPPEMEKRVRQRAAELEKTQGKPLALVSGWMGAVEKLIEGYETDEDPTQQKQVEITVALQKLVELQEARERNASGCCSGEGPGKGKRPGRPKGNRSSAPAEMSALVDAKGSKNLGIESRGDASKVWGLLKERQGAEALQSFRAKLPTRYQKLLEQYYKGTARKSGSAGR